MVEFKFPVSGKTRTEHDLLGYKEVPVEALFGIQTLRCIENFDISNYHLCDYPEFIKAFGIVKMAAIKANHTLGLVSDQIKDAVVAACQELIDEHECQRGDRQPRTRAHGPSEGRVPVLPSQ